MARLPAPGQGRTTPSIKGAPIRVRALRQGHYDLIRRRVGDVFVCDESAFSKTWMEKVSADTPDKVTTGQEELRRQHDEEMRARAGLPAATSDLDVI